MSAPIIDAHAHVSSRQFGDDLDAALQRAWDAGLVGIVEAGDDVASGQRALDLARRDPRISNVLLIPSGLDTPFWAKLQELRDAIQDFKQSGKYVHAWLEYAGDRYGLQLERLRVGDDFNPEVGFLRRLEFGDALASLLAFGIQVVFALFMLRLFSPAAVGEFSVLSQTPGRLIS